MPSPKASSVSSLPLSLDIDDFKGDFSFDALFGGLVNELLPAFREDDADAADPSDSLPNGHMRAPSDASKLPPGAVAGVPLFPEVDALLTLFKDSCKDLVNLRHKIDSRLQNLKKEATVQNSKHR